MALSNTPKLSEINVELGLTNNTLVQCIASAGKTGIWSKQSEFALYSGIPTSPPGTTELYWYGNHYDDLAKSIAGSEILYSNQSDHMYIHRSSVLGGINSFYARRAGGTYPTGDAVTFIYEVISGSVLEIKITKENSQISILYINNATPNGIQQVTDYPLSTTANDFVLQIRSNAAFELKVYGIYTNNV